MTHKKQFTMSNNQDQDVLPYLTSWPGKANKRDRMRKNKLRKTLDSRIDAIQAKGDLKKYEFEKSQLDKMSIEEKLELVHCISETMNRTSRAKKNLRSSNFRRKLKEHGLNPDGFNVEGQPGMACDVDRYLQISCDGNASYRNQILATHQLLYVSITSSIPTQAFLEKERVIAQQDDGLRWLLTESEDEGKQEEDQLSPTGLRWSMTDSEDEDIQRS